MMVPDLIRKRLFRITDDREFNDIALEIFHFQYEYNPVYRSFCEHTRKAPGNVDHIRDIPFLPIGFFKNHRIITPGTDEPRIIFTSSGTSGSATSKHFVKDTGLYRDSFIGAFTRFYGDPEMYRFLVLLPGYLERQGSSLVYMMEEMVRRTEHHGSGFFLHDLKALSAVLSEPSPTGRLTILFGASYALLDFAEQYGAEPGNVIVMETGGMKGRKKEMVREELHAILCRNLGVEAIHSEYGMTELLSQAYSAGKGIFRTPSWMKVLTRDINDPLEMLPPGQTGGINVIDLANLYSCSFIATQDLGKLNDDGSFEVLGRFDDSDTRGCNLLVV